MTPLDPPSLRRQVQQAPRKLEALVQERIAAAHPQTRDAMDDRGRSRGCARSFFADVHALQSRWDVRRHPFFVRWSDGGLDASELARYAGEYEHVVIALAVAAKRAADAAPAALTTELADHAREEARHIGLWRAFREAIGGVAVDAPDEATVRCARGWVGSRSRSLEATLAVLYAIESSQPRIAELKRDGLVRHYGVRDPAVTAYFDVHVERGHGRARRARELLEPRLHSSIEAALLGCVDVVLAGYWQLLSALERDGAAVAS